MTGVVRPAAPEASVVAALLAPIGRCRVVGVVNVTDDSFSDGGLLTDPDVAVNHGMALAAAGADIVDVGGESTRPGAARVPADVERDRVLPVVTGLAAAGVVVSIDTTRSATAQAAIEAGARLVNDVSGGTADPDLPALVAGHDVGYVVTHSRGPSADMQSRAHYDDVVGEVRGELADRLERVVAAGVPLDRVVLDPGLGFAKTAAHNWSLLAHLEVIAGLGRPLLVGASRKDFLGRALADPDGAPRPVGRRDDATTAVTVVAALAGAWGVRVHAVAPSADAVRVAAAVSSAAGVGPTAAR